MTAIKWWDDDGNYTAVNQLMMGDAVKIDNEDNDEYFVTKLSISARLWFSTLSNDDVAYQLYHFLAFNILVLWFKSFKILDFFIHFM